MSAKARGGLDLIEAMMLIEEARTTEGPGQRRRPAQTVFNRR